MRRHLAAILLATSLLATACGAGDGADGGSAAPGEPDKVTVGVIPILDVAPIYLGVEKGFFAELDIDLELTQAEGGAAIVPAVVSEQYQFGFSNVVSLLLAQSEGLPVKVVSNGNNSTGVDGEDFAGLMVKADSPIRSAKDLEGRTVAANTLQNIVDTSVRASVREAGGDPSKVKFVALPFPEQPAALANGQVDAVFVVEPFQQAVLAEGGRKIASSYVDAADDLTVAVYFTSRQLQAENPDLVRRFTEAMQESLSYADSHPDEARQIIGTYTEIAPEVIEKLTLPKWPSDINRDSLETMADLAVEDGLLKETPDLNALLP
ncbi:ABC transporter substrate-binding protein [Actinophytocola algeriensis]|uniref:NitT/TauT family transport system substrate-binding protein n=1 Tax=Actinophytocola algeriensis TaxID=1768010 RepID=A0A7W7Q6E7_9PSEU|nr:ABC transporter substrate-binding protein [Actinophytocola algeriensis]MBB4907792.1 NitT/TauT family transport system substrate-binding protein [Actinophytocola algeriensis]MBE1479822.1 NitT/TauT family transport system substrate-binding protein [Actinophytocola algeriensis]